MGFKAEQEIDILDFDFRPYAEVSGVTPEPTTEQLKTFQRTMKALIGPQLEAIKEGKPIELPDDEEDELYEELLSAVADLCSQTPSYEELHDLPFRLQQHFLGYMVGKFVSPEMSAPATRLSVVGANTA